MKKETAPVPAKTGMPKSTKNILFGLGGIAIIAATYFILKGSKTDEPSNNVTGSKSPDEKQSGITSIKIQTPIISEVEKNTTNIFYNKYSFSATITVINPPKSGTLIVSLDGKVIKSASLPILNDGFGKDTLFVLSFEVADGSEHSITATIDEGKATETYKFKAPMPV